MTASVWCSSFALLVACAGATEVRRGGVGEAETAESAESAGSETLGGAELPACAHEPRLDSAGRPTGFPAWDPEAGVIVLYDPHPEAFMTNMMETRDAPRVVFLGLDGAVARVMELKSRDEVDPDHYVDWGCCESREEDCDPYVCMMGEEGEAYEAELAPRVAERAAAINGALAGVSFLRAGGRVER